MLDVLEAERLKLARHRATWFLVWVYPIGIALLLLAYAFWEVASGGPPEMPGPPQTAASWMREGTFVWQGPAGTFGRYMLAAFTAVAFGGEYGWNTWKLVVPHRGRVALIAGKYLMVLGLLLAGMVLGALVTVLGAFLVAPLDADPLPQGIGVMGLLEAHGRAALKMLPAVLLTLAYASAGAVLTRSTLAGAIIAIVLVTAEAVFGQVAPMLAMVVAPKVLEPLYHALPSYHLANLGTWIDSGRALGVPMPSGRVAHPWAVSLAVLTAWVGGLVALTVLAFRRQDLN